jgi:hypothetical protein
VLVLQLVLAQLCVQARELQVQGSVGQRRKLRILLPKIKYVL